MNTLTFLTITNGDGAFVPKFLTKLERSSWFCGAAFYLVADGEEGAHACEVAKLKPNRRVESQGYIESVLDEVIAGIPTDYILRLDDDELPSPAMERWLQSGAWEAEDLWAFPRAHLWEYPQQYILNPPLWPDLQTRLSTKAKAGGRTQIHVGSPFGTGKVAPACIEHHKFLVRSYKERELIAARYENIRPGAGFSPTYGMMNLPEMFFEKVMVKDYGDGRA